MESALFQGLNEAQREAVTHKDGPMLVLAGPGSGKTRVVTHRIAYLIEQGIPGRNIAALTFTNKAADEMRERLALLVPDSRVWIGTFHRFCSWILRCNIERVGLQPNFTIYDTDQTKHLIETLIDKRDLPNGCDAAKILTAISWAKNALILPGNYAAKEGHILGKITESIYPKYQQALKAANAVDFDDLLLCTAVLLKDNEEIRSQLDDRFRYMLVDEYQDTNLVQYAIARALSRDNPNLAVTGDPDQSIYGWRGANIRNILDFEKDFQNVHVVRLEENYRSCGNILAAAGALIKHNKERKEKNLYTHNEAGKKPRILCCYNHQEEADSIAAEIAEEIASGQRRPGDYAVFFRMNALSRNLERAFRQNGVPFALVRGLEFFSRKEIKDILAYFQLIYNPRDTIAFQRVVNLPVRGIGKVTVNRIADFAEQHRISLFDAAVRVREIPEISTRAQKSVKMFAEMISRLAAAAPDSDLETLLTLLLGETKYLAGFSGETEEDKQRLANVQELLSEVREFDKMFSEEEAEAAEADIPFLDDSFALSDRLGRFLEQAALTSDADAYDKSDRVSLMTLHAAKGLEFPVVYIIALEDNIIPHERSAESKKQLEEERRLFFVGMTRAQEELRMSRTEFREYRGRYAPTILSRFLFDIPADLLEIRNLHSEEKLWREPVKPAEKPMLLSDYLEDLEKDETAGNQTSEAERCNWARKTSSRILKKTDEGLTFEANEFCDSPADETGTVLFDDNGNLIPAGRIPRKKNSVNRESSLHLQMGTDLENEPALAIKKKNWDAGGKQEPKIGMLLKHADFGVGFIRAVFGPPSGRIVTVEFLSRAGKVDISVSDPAVKILFRGK